MGEIEWKKLMIMYFKEKKCELCDFFCYLLAWVRRSPEPSRNRFWRSTGTFPCRRDWWRRYEESSPQVRLSSYDRNFLRVEAERPLPKRSWAPVGPLHRNGIRRPCSDLWWPTYFAYNRNELKKENKGNSSVIIIVIVVVAAGAI